MARTFSLIALAAAPALAGCFAGLDDGALTRGGAPAPGPGSGADAGGPPAPGAQDGASPPQPSTCDDFSSDAPGGTIANWTFEDGTWIVVAAGATHVLTQAQPHQGSRYYAFTGRGDWRSYRIAATLTPTQTDHSDCIDARRQDRDDRYALCLHDGTGWSLMLYQNGSRSQLAGGRFNYDPNSTHVLELEVRGDQLTPTLDGDRHDAVTDGTFERGPAGISTSSPLTIARYCVTLE